MLEFKRMKKWAQSGFTLIESLIFLVIAGGLIASTIAILYNRQRQIEFSQSVRQFELDINDLINDTTTGNFPVVEGVVCQQQLGTNELVFSADPDAIPGRNRDCILLGKVIQLGASTDKPPTPDDSYGVHTLLGSSLLQQGSYRGSPYITTLFNSSSPHFDTFESVILGWRTGIADAYYIDATTDKIHYVSGLVLAYAEFGSHFNTGGAFFGDFQSGSSRVSIFAIESGDSIDLNPTPAIRPTTAASNRPSQTAFRDFLTGDTSDPNYQALNSIVSPKSDIVVCLISLATGKKAALEIGTEGGAPRARANFDIDSTECIYD